MTALSTAPLCLNIQLDANSFLCRLVSFLMCLIVGHKIGSWNNNLHRNAADVSQVSVNGENGDKV